MSRRYFGTDGVRGRVGDPPEAGREGQAHLEAVGRLLAGIAPWIELPADNSAEGRLRGEYANLARTAIGRIVTRSLLRSGARPGDRLYLSRPIGGSGAGFRILTSGAASYVGVSPLLPAMIVGIMLVNTSAIRVEIWRPVSMS